MRDPSPEQRLQSMVTGLKASGLGLSEMSRETGVSRTTLWRAEVGQTSKVSASVFERVEAVYQSREMRR